MKIKLLVDIHDSYLNMHFKKDKIYPVLDRYMYSINAKEKIIYCGGHGVYVYVNPEDYIIIKDNNEIN
jgi:hypothetical protein